MYVGPPPSESRLTWVARWRGRGWAGSGPAGAVLAVAVGGGGVATSTGPMGPPTAQPDRISARPPATAAHRARPPRPARLRRSPGTPPPVRVPITDRPYRN